MGLKFELASLEGLDEAVSGLYVEQDGKYYLDVEGVVSKKKHDEFRQNNIDLRRQLESYQGLTAEDALKFKKLAESGEFDKDKVNLMVEERVKQLRDEFTAKETEYVTSISSLDSRLSAVLIDSEVKGAAVKNGVVASAVDDVMLRARAVFQLKDGEVQAFDSKGHMMYDKDGTTPLSIESWVKGLKKSAGHLFEGHVGGGAPGNRGGRPVANMTAAQKISAGLSS